MGAVWYATTAHMLSRQGGLNLEIKCPCARKTWHEREVGVSLKWAYFRETTVIIIVYIAKYINIVA